MHIGFDGMIWGGQETGVATATRRLFLRVAAESVEHELTAFVSDKAEVSGLDGKGMDRCRVVRCAHRARDRRVLWQQFVLPLLARRHGLDVLVCPCYTVPLISKVPSVVVVHDMIAWKRPDLCRRLNVCHFRALLGISVRRAARVMVPTTTVKEDVLSILDAPEHKVHRVPWGVDFEITPMEHDTAREIVLSDFGIDAPYVFTVGCLEPKKNLSATIEATRRIGAVLVAVGPAGWDAATRQAIENQGGEHCRYLGYVTVLQLSALYSAAEAFVFPSHIEGFGLPALEAMACGAPVIASNAPALLEVCGGAALHAPSSDVGALISCLRKVIGDAELRERLRQRGRQHAREFSWDCTVRQFWEVIESIVRR